LEPATTQKLLYGANHDRPQRGRPVLAEGAAAQQILQEMADLSAPYGRRSDSLQSGVEPPHFKAFGLFAEQSLMCGGAPRRMKIGFGSEQVGPGFSPDSGHLGQDVRADAGMPYGFGAGPG